MPINPNLPLQVQQPRYGEIIGTGIQNYRERKRQEAADQRQNALIQLKQQEEQRQQMERDRKDILRQTAIKGSEILPLFDQDPQKAQDLISENIRRGGKDVVAWTDLWKLNQQDPQRAKQALEQATNQARFEKLIPEIPKTGKPEKFTPESLKSFEKTGGRESELRPRDVTDEGLNRLPTIAEQFKLVGPKGQRPELGKTLKQLKDEGFKVQPRISKQAQNQIKNVDATMKTLEKLALGEVGEEGVREGGVFTAKAGAVNRLWDDAKKTWNRISQDTKEQALYESFANGTTAQLCRAVGEKGNLSNRDVERCINLIPSTGEGLTQLPDTREVAENKLKQLRGWFDEMLGSRQEFKEGDTIINRSTGERMIMRGGKWRQYQKDSR